MIFRTCVNMIFKKINSHRNHTRSKNKELKSIFKLYQTSYNLSTIENHFSLRSAHSLYLSELILKMVSNDEFRFFCTQTIA